MKEANGEKFFKELLSFAAIALIIVLPVRLFIAQPFVVSGASMEPTFENGEYLIVDEATYLLRDPERGEVVIFRYPKDPSKYFIKRIIGLPGETIRIQGDTVSVTTPQGEVLTLPENYVVNHGNGNTEELALGTEEYFVMGDNRPASSDSRMWGVLTEDHIIGRAFLRLLPPTKLDLFPGSLESFTERVQ